MVCGSEAALLIDREFEMKGFRCAILSGGVEIYLQEAVPDVLWGYCFTGGG
ncbi:MAG: hypothetical protein LUC98_01995 [Lachnospiraceae bacterium]|nr:hypothetical protein [Lachnospiraceae bacterium]